MRRKGMIRLLYATRLKIVCRQGPGGTVFETLSQRWYPFKFKAGGKPGEWIPLKQWKGLHGK